MSGCVRTRTIAPVGIGHSASPQSESVVFVKPVNPFLQPIGPTTIPVNEGSSMDSMPGMSHGSSGLTVYSCPMHPDVRQDRPGTCSKCGMTLIPSSTQEPQQHQHGGMP